jgi:hypothetical protein
MEHVYIYDAIFLDNKTIRLSEESSVSEQKVGEYSLEALAMALVKRET